MLIFRHIYGKWWCGLQVLLITFLSDRGSQLKPPPPRKVFWEGVSPRSPNKHIIYHLSHIIYHISFIIYHLSYIPYTSNLHLRKWSLNIRGYIYIYLNQVGYNFKTHSHKLDPHNKTLPHVRPLKLLTFRPGDRTRPHGGGRHVFRMNRSVFVGWFCLSGGGFFVESTSGLQRGPTTPKKESLKSNHQEFIPK